MKYVVLWYREKLQNRITINCNTTAMQLNQFVTNYHKITEVCHW